MDQGKLFITSKENFRVQKILVAAKYSGKTFKLQDKFDPDQFPLASLPSGAGFEVKQGNGAEQKLSKSLAIAYFLSSEALKGGDNDLAKAECLQWLLWGEEDLLPVLFNHVFPILGLLPKQKSQEVKTELLRLLQRLNEDLAVKTFLVGDRISLADISIALNLVLLFKHGLLPEERDKFVHLMRWFNTIVNQKHVKDVLGAMEFCDKLEALPQEAVKGFRI